MTRPPDGQPPLWLKMVPNNEVNADGAWTRVLLKDHHTVRRSRQPDHGDRAVCCCGERGRFDADTGPQNQFEDSIWVDRNGGVVCVGCVLK